MNACACGAVQSGTCDGAGRKAPAHRRLHVSPLTTEPLSTEHVPHACNAGHCTAQAQGRPNGRTASQRAALALATDCPTAQYNTTQHNTQSRVRTQPPHNRRSRKWGRGCRPESAEAEAVGCRAVVGRGGSTRSRFRRQKKTAVRSALEHHRTTLESDTTTRHNAREADAPSIQRMQRCVCHTPARASGAAAAKVKAEPGHRRSGRLRMRHANAKGEGTHRLTSHSLHAGSGQRASARH